MTIRLLLVPVLLVSLHPVQLCADDQVRSVQEELRRRNLYFGDIDGRETSEVDEAVKRYQKRKGLNTVGVRDSDTLRSLGLAGRGDAPPKALPWPEGPVLRSDMTINVAKAADELAQETGVAPASIVGERLADFDPSSRTARGARGKARQVSPTPGASTGGGGANAGGAGRGGRGAASAPGDMRKFVREFLAAAGSKTLRDELRFYADRLSYYGNGVIDRRIVERALARYHEQWPHRRYRMGDVVDYRFDAQRAEILVTYQIAFTLKGHGKSVKGWTQNRMVINAATSDPRIVSIEEQRGR